MNDISRLTCVVLAGGAGIRLRSVLGNRPKALAEVCGRPFLQYLFDLLADSGITDVVVCIGYLGEQIKLEFRESYKTLHLRYSQESPPLGTAGALLLASPLLNSDTVLVLNGDSYCGVNLEGFMKWHCSRESDATILLVNNAETKRYGQVHTDTNGRILGFDEKIGSNEAGLINAGIYLVRRSLLQVIPDTGPVSLERDVFPRWIGKNFYGYQTDSAFIDIGTPESYAQAEKFFSQRPLQ